MKKRIEWVDYFRGLAIILVVVGHATPVFNKYIYQFHVAAFFVIAGYVSNIKKKGILELLIDKIFSLVIPYTFFAIVGVSVVWVLDKCSVLQYVSSIQEVPSYQELVKTIYSWLRCDWLGASWFIVAMLGAIAVQKIILIICGNRVGIVYGLLTVGLYVAAYSWVRTGFYPIAIHNIALYSVVQMYYGIGVIAAEINQKSGSSLEKIVNSGLLRMGLLLFNFIGFYVLANIFGYCMSIDSLGINSPVVDLLLVLNGTVFLWNISCILSKIKMERVKSVLAYIGRNTMGILFLHFVCFKIVTLVIAVFDKQYLGVISWLCPPNTIPFLWVVYVIVSISGSLLIWRFLKQSGFLSVLIGENKQISKSVYKTICRSRYVNEIVNILEMYIEEQGNIGKEFTKEIKQNTTTKMLIIVCFVSFVVYILI